MLNRGQLVIRRSGGRLGPDRLSRVSSRHDNSYGHHPHQYNAYRRSESRTDCSCCRDARGRASGNVRRRFPFWTEASARGGACVSCVAAGCRKMMNNTCSALGPALYTAYFQGRLMQSYGPWIRHHQMLRCAALLAAIGDLGLPRCGHAGCEQL
jgi:hypothetical protein